MCKKASNKGIPRILIFVSGSPETFLFNGKAIQKICESYRVADDWKKSFKDLRAELKK